MMDSFQSNSTYDAVDDSQPWQPGTVTRLPWLGIGALLGSIVGVGASIAVLVMSNGSRISVWKFQPTVYLSIASTLTNIMLHFALSEGVTIAWWRKAMKGHTQLGDLHRYWEFGNSFLAASTSGRRFNLVALASILATVAPINGPLLQRASRVTIHTTAVSKILHIPVLPLLNKPTGYMSGRGHNVSLITEEFSPIVQNYYGGVSVNMNNTGCDGICTGRVRGAGFAVNCSSFTVPFSVEPARNIPGVDNPVTQSAINGTNVFRAGFSWSYSEPSNLTLRVLYKDTSECTGDLIVQTCSFRAATVLYPVVIDSNKSTIALDPDSTIFDDVLERTADLAVESWGQGPTILGGFWFALNNRFVSTAHLRWVGAVGYELTSTGSTAAQYAVLEDMMSQNASFNSGMCHIRYTNPIHDLLQQTREFVFRTAVAGANSSTLQQMTAQQVSTHAVYESHYVFLAIAVLVTMIAILGVTAIFHGYWHLGRKVTMSPIETAKAFNAPLLSNEDPNAKVESLIRKVGSRRVRYGVVLTETFDGEHYIVPKRFNHVETIEMDVLSRGRLQIADESVVQKPLKGWKASI